MEISVITLTWNSSEHIIDQIRSVIKATQGIVAEQIIVDNGSFDNTVALIKKEFPNVKLVANGKNLGFSAGNNIGAKIATGKYLLFLNPDTELKNSLKPLLEWLNQNPDVGIAGGKLVDQANNLNPSALPRRFPTWRDQLAIVLKLPHLFPAILNHYLYHGFNTDQEQAVDSVRGSCLILKRELYEKLGFAFDPRYFIWFEDVDLCRSAWQLNYRVMYTPRLTCLDLVGASFKRRNYFWKQFQFIRSMLKYFIKWGAA